MSAIDFLRAFALFDHLVDVNKVIFHGCAGPLASLFRFGDHILKIAPFRIAEQFLEITAKPYVNAIEIDGLCFKDAPEASD